MALTKMKVMAACVLVCTLQTVTLAQGIKKSGGARLNLDAEPEMVGISSQRLARYTAWIDEKVSSGFYPFARTIIAKNGDIVYDYATEQYGNASLGTLQHSDTVYRFYSMSKIITSVGVAMLEEQGKLSYSDRVSKYLPEWDKSRMKVSVGEYDANHNGTLILEPAKKAITIRHLLTHTAGLGYSCFLCLWNFQTPVDQAYMDAGFDLLNGDLSGYVNAFTKADPPNSLFLYSKAFADLPLKFEPGTHFEYSVGPIIAGAIIEKITGVTYVDWITENLFKPLGMAGMRATTNEHTVPVYQGGADIPRETELAGLDYVTEPFTLVKGPWGPDYVNANGVAMPDGGWLGTAKDMMTFMLTLGHGKGRAPNGYQLLSPASVHMLMHENHLEDGKFVEHGFVLESTLRETGHLGHALGGVVYMDGYDIAHANIAAVKGTYQWCGAANTDFTIDPVNDLQILFLSSMFHGLWRTDGYGLCSAPGIGKKLIYASLDSTITPKTKTKTTTNHNEL